MVGGSALADDPDWTAAMIPNVRQMAPNFLIAGVLPLIAYGLLRPHVSSDAVALLAVLVFPLGEIAWERRRSGRFEPIGIIALIGISIGILGAVVFSGNDFLLKVRDSIVTSLFGVACLATLPTTKPMMFRLGRAFATGGDPERQKVFDDRAQLPGALGRFRLVTAAWGTGLVLEGGSRVLLAATLSTGTFLVVSQVVGVAVIGGLLVWTVRFSRRAEQQLRGAPAAA